MSGDGIMAAELVADAAHAWGSNEHGRAAKVTEGIVLLAGFLQRSISTVQRPKAALPLSCCSCPELQACCM